MVITEITISLPRKDPNLRIKAYADITINGELIISGLKIVDSSTGLFVAMPAKKGKSHKYRDVVTPISREIRQQINQEVLTAYQKYLAAHAVS
jgi:stage V sporulation protein G